METLVNCIQIFLFLTISCLDADKLCQDGQLCPDSWSCCTDGCCASTFTTPTLHLDYNRRNIDLDNIWHVDWPILFVACTILGISVCCVWCMCFRARSCSIWVWCSRREPSDDDSAGSCYPPPRYSRCGSFHQPPPYTEVTTKPDLYPLVISCGEGENKAENYLMVQYFKNYVFRTPRSLSATSTAESLNSYLCSATNEANTIIPPPYSCADEYEQCRVGVSRTDSVLRPMPPLSEISVGRARTPEMLRDSLIISPERTMNSSFDLDLELIDYEMCCDSGCRPRLGQSPPGHSPNIEENVFDHDFDQLRRLYSFPCLETCESPPQPTSPTQTSTESTLKRNEESRRRIEKRKKRKLSLYMPISSGSYAVRPRASSSKSAPVTPCGLMPNLMIMSQRMSTSRLSSKSKLDEEEDLLLSNEKNIDNPDR